MVDRQQTHPPVPLSVPTAAGVLEFLRQLGASDAPAGKLISGHWCGASFAPSIDVDWAFALSEVERLHQATGHWPGLISCWLQPGWSAWGGGEALDTQMWFDAIKAGFRQYWEAGGLLHAGASFSCPLADHYGDRYFGRKEQERPLLPSADALLTPGTPQNGRWMAMLDRIAEFFGWCDDQQMVVIWRPFTECYLSQFWYGKLADEDFRRLWQHMWTYFMVDRQVRCLLWEFNGRNRQDGYFPGDPYVDLFASSSSYDDGLVRLDDTGSRPWAQGELGDQTDYLAWIEKAKSLAPYMVYFLTWDRGFGPCGHPSSGNSREFNATYIDAVRHPWVINRDELGRSAAWDLLTGRV